MSNRWPGGLIRKTPVTPAGPLQNGAAPGVWTLAEATYWQKQGLWPIAGNFLAVEDVFSTYLYTGNGSTQTITNGIDLSGNGGLVWLKNRANTTNHILFDTARNAFALSSNLVNAEGDYTGYFSFTSSGFSVGAIGAYNQNNYGIASWSFRKAPKFFDVVTYNGTGTSSQTLSHSLGVEPGLIIVKRTNSTDSWKVYHRGLASPNTSSLLLNNTTAATNWGIGLWGQPSDTSFAVNNATLQLNTSGGTYVAYLFAHDATADGIIQCGSFTTDGSDNATVNLGWEPQFVMVKQSSATSDWVMLDTMRGWPVSASDAYLRANSSAAENVETTDYISPTSTGFQVKGMWGTPGGTSVYMAIRRGPMKTPTVGTSVFSPNAVTPSGSTTITTGFAPDMAITRERSAASGFGSFFVLDKLRGSSNTGPSQGNIQTTSIVGESTWPNYGTGFTNTGIIDTIGTTLSFGASIYWSFRRAPSFFDEVCYTGTGANLALNHNLGVVPELMLVKRRNTTGAWQVYSANLANTEYLVLNTTAAKATGTTRWNSTTPTSTVFTVGTDATVNASGGTYVAYLFATCPGVSKVGTYTGNGTSQTINCGFTTGARYFLVKRTDSTGDWWVWDSARGITAPADPALALNSTAAEVTSADATDPDNSGIIVNQEATCNINVNGATYIFLAIA